MGDLPTIMTLSEPPGGGEGGGWGDPDSYDTLKAAGNCWEGVGA